MSQSQFFPRNELFFDFISTLVWFVMSQVEDKDKKIADLRSLLTQAKSKIE